MEQRPVIRAPKVSDKQLLLAFEYLCRLYGVVSRGFEPKKITAPIDGKDYDGTPQWAVTHTAQGWMIVCGAGGCGAKFVRWNGYVRTRWDFLMLIEALTNAEHIKPKSAHPRTRKLKKQVS